MSTCAGSGVHLVDGPSLSSAKRGGVAGGNGGAAVTVGGVAWQWYYVRLFQNKKLVCWSDDTEHMRQQAPERMIDLFDVRCDISPHLPISPHISPNIIRDPLSPCLA